MSALQSGVVNEPYLYSYHCHLYGNLLYSHMCTTQEYLCSCYGYHKVNFLKDIHQRLDMNKIMPQTYW